MVRHAVTHALVVTAVAKLTDRSTIGYADHKGVGRLLLLARCAALVTQKAVGQAHGLVFAGVVHGQHGAIGQEKSAGQVGPSPGQPQRRLVGANDFGAGEDGPAAGGQSGVAIRAPAQAAALAQAQHLAFEAEQQHRLEAVVAVRHRKIDGKYQGPQRR